MLYVSENIMNLATYVNDKCNLPYFYLFLYCEGAYFGLAYWSSLKETL